MDSTRWQPASRLKQLQQRWQNLPQPKTEESIPLRIVVQALVIVGILATDVAAGTQVSLWAVPLSIMGSAISWWRRKRRNVALKFVIAIAMLAALMVFFGNLIENINDTRLVLAELLINVQILHSFDLPRRKDLGYSVIIGLILLSVAGSISETVAFAPFIVVFLAIAIPVMVLDYRSRLGLAPPTLQWQSSKRATTSHETGQLSGQWSRWVLLFVLVMGLGLALFAAMPRFPGYQLQTFPVSAPTDLDNLRFDAGNPSIVNPGLEGAGESGTAGPDGSGGDGTSERVYYGFDQNMDQSQPPSAPPEPKIVMRVRSQAPGFWRVLAFDRYTGQGWQVSRDDQAVTQQRPSWSYRFSISLPDPPLRARQIIQTYTIVEDMPNLLPVLSHPRALYFPTPEIATDPEGSLRSPATLSKDLTYTAISGVPIRDRQRIGQAPQDYPDRITQYYLQIPDEVANTLRPIAQELLATATSPPGNPYEIALFLAQALKQNYAINPDFFIFPGMDIATAFVSQGGGYPDQFSTVLTLMLRSLGIPARLAAGFAPGQFNPFTGFYLVRTSDAFSLTEVFFPGQGWYTFDPIPGHEIIPPSYVDNETFGIVRQAWNWVAGWLPTPLRAWITQVVTLVVGSILGAIVTLWRWMSSSLPSFLIGSMGLLATSFSLWLGGTNLWRWWRMQRLRRLPPMERIYRQMLLHLENKGHQKLPAQTPLEYANVCQTMYPDAIAIAITQITHAYLYWRYNHQTPDVAQMQAALRTVQRQSRLSSPLAESIS